MVLGAALTEDAVDPDYLKDQVPKVTLKFHPSPAD